MQTIQFSIIRDGQIERVARVDIEDCVRDSSRNLSEGQRAWRQLKANPKRWLSVPEMRSKSCGTIKRTLLIYLPRQSHPAELTRVYAAIMEDPVFNNEDLDLYFGLTNDPVPHVEYSWCEETPDDDFLTAYIRDLLGV